MADSQIMHSIRKHLEQLDENVKRQLWAKKRTPAAVISEYNHSFARVDSSTQTIPENIIVSPKTIFEGTESEWIFPADARTDLRILYMPGGSWCNADIESYRPLVARIAESTGMCVLLVRCRIAPEHPFPAGLADSLASYTRMLVAGPIGSQNASRTFIAGDSTGANMVLALLFLLRARNLTMPDAAILFSPITDCCRLMPDTDTQAFYGDSFLQACLASYALAPYDIASPLLSPINGDLAGLPDLYVQVSEAENVFEDVVAFVKKARKSKVKVKLRTWADMPNGFQRFAPFLPQANEALGDLGKFLSKYKKTTVIPFPVERKPGPDQAASK